MRWQPMQKPRTTLSRRILRGALVIVGGMISSLTSGMDNMRAGEASQQQSAAVVPVKLKSAE